jgi:hypothetical protein
MRKTSTRFDGLNLFGFPVRADTAALPSTELVNIAKTASIKPARQRDARWDVERKGRETKV